MQHTVHIYKSKQWDYSWEGIGTKLSDVAATVVMGWDYDVDVAMSGSCIYCCAYTSEVLCTLLVSHLYIV